MAVISEMDTVVGRSVSGAHVQVAPRAGERFCLHRAFSPPVDMGGQPLGCRHSRFLWLVAQVQEVLLRHQGACF